MFRVYGLAAPYIIGVAFSSDETCDDAKTVSVSAPPNGTTSGLWVVPRLAHRIHSRNGEHARALLILLQLRLRFTPLPQTFPNCLA